MSRKHTRRDFVKGATLWAGAAAAASVAHRPATAGPPVTRPAEKLNIAGIGVGGMGSANLRNLESENIVALCDVDKSYAAAAIARYSKAAFFTDYREMLEKCKEIDAVVVATPDHTHAVISAAAMKAGKHVYW